MSSIGTQEHSKHTSIKAKDIVQPILTVLAIVISAYISLKVAVTIIDTKFEDYKKEVDLKQQFLQKQLDVQTDHSKSQDEKMDLILDGIHRIELQLKDKQDRPQ